MASHHHPHHHQPQPPTTFCCTSSYSSCCCTQTHHPCPPPPPPPPPAASDPVPQAIASHFLQSNPPDPYSPHPQLHRQNPRQTHKSPHPKHHFHLQNQQEQLQTHSIISSLLSRIESLEASLRNYSLYRSRSSYSYSQSLRDVAARVIQTHFRAFLVRRSRTLRQLKDLAFVKSAYHSLKSSISNDTHFDFHALSQKAIDLLLKLDSIQGGEPIVRDGKRSISRDLVRFLELIDGVIVKRHGLPLKAVKNVRFGQNVKKSSRVLPTKCSDLGRDQKEMIGKLRDRIEKIRGFARVSENDEEDVELEGFQHVSDEDEENLRVINGKASQLKNGVLVKRHGLQPKLKKNVSFAENGNVLRVFSNTDETASSGDGSDSSDDHGELVEHFCSEVEDVKGFAQETEDEDEAHTENVGSPQASSDGERNPRARMTQRREDIYETKGHGHGQSGYLAFSAPLPVKMESKSRYDKKL